MFSKRRTPWEWGILVLTCLSPLLAVAQVNAQPDAPATPSALARVKQHLSGPQADTKWARLSSVLTGRETLLEYLPLDSLREVTLEGDAFELRFDFGNKKSTKIRIPAEEQLVLVSKTGQLTRSTTKGRTIVVKRSVRFHLAGDQIASVREGDLKVCYGPFRPSLKLRTERCPGQLVRDGEGRVVVALDTYGRPLLKGADYVPRTAEHWLVLEAKGRTVEIPLG